MHPTNLRIIRTSGPVRSMTSSPRIADKTSQPKLAVTNEPIELLKLDANNPRLHSRTQIRQIARCIESFGYNVPVLVDAELNVVAGHGRLLACRHLGWSEVPTIRLDHLDAAQRRAFAIADNRLNETSTWDDRLLAQQLKDLSVLDLDFSLESTGFEMGEIDLRIESLNAPDEAETEPVETLVEGPAVSKTGDLWLLGNHRVLCGSALEPLDLAALMGTDRAAIVFTDPPYNVPINGHVSTRSGQHREFAMASGEMTSAGFELFLTGVFKLLLQHAVPGSLHYVCMDWRHVGEIVAAGRDVYRELLNICVWTKPNAGMGSLYRSQHELVFVFQGGDGPICNNVQLGRFGRNRSNVWAYAGQPAFGRAGEEGRLGDLHPTVKPIAMVADAILDSSRRGDIVLDPFLGSGTTLMAAERTGRACYGLEIDPLYVDVTVRRWQAHTGGIPIHAASSLPFDAIATKAAEASPSPAVGPPPDDPAGAEVAGAGSSRPHRRRTGRGG